MNKNQLPVSVIVPVYNAETTLERCISSINAVLPPEQIIIVDDSSTDGSVRLARNLAIAQSNIKLICRSQKGGAADARRDGLFAAVCDYYAFVDADDYLEHGALQEAYNSLIETQSDLCILQLWRSANDRVWEHVNLDIVPFPITGRDAAERTLGAWSIHPLGVAKKQIYLQAYANLSLASMNSDELITRLALINAKKVICCKKKYFYTVNLQSTTNSIHPGRLTVLDSDIWLLEFCKTHAFAKTAAVLEASTRDMWSLFRLRKSIGVAETRAKLVSFTRHVFFVSGFFPNILRHKTTLVKFALVSLYCRLPFLRK